MRLDYDQRHKENFQPQDDSIGRRVQVILIFALLLATTLVVGCVSLNIGPKAAAKSSGVVVDSPQSPFKSLSDTKADGAWENKSNGNVISYLSTCSESGETPLDVAANETFSDLQEQKIINQVKTTFNGREAYDEEVEGEVEGVPTRIHVVLFNKNGCLYTLSYVGLARNFDVDRGSFSSFLKGFRAP